MDMRPSRPGSDRASLLPERSAAALDPLGAGEALGGPGSLARVASLLPEWSAAALGSPGAGEVLAGFGSLARLGCPTLQSSSFLRAGQRAAQESRGLERPGKSLGLATLARVPGWVPEALESLTPESLQPAVCTAGIQRLFFLAAVFVQRPKTVTRLRPSLS